MGIRLKHIWIPTIANVIVWIPLFLFLAEICPCHNHDESVCHASACCSDCMPEPLSEHRTCPCLVCASDTVAARIPQKAVLPDIGRTIQLDWMDPEAGQVITLSNAAGLDFASLFQENTGIFGPARHIDSTVLRI